LSFYLLLLISEVIDFCAVSNPDVLPMFKAVRKCLGGLFAFEYFANSEIHANAIPIPNDI